MRYEDEYRERLIQRNQEAQNYLDQASERVNEINEKIQELENALAAKAADCIAAGDLSEAFEMQKRIYALKEERGLLEAAMPELERREYKTRQDPNVVKLQRSRRVIEEFKAKAKAGRLDQERVDYELPEMLVHAGRLHEGEELKGFLQEQGFTI